MFAGFFYHLRAMGLKVGLTEWLSLMQAISRGHERAALPVFYHLARSLLVKREGQYDLYDRAFAAYFGGVEEQFANIDDAILEWLQDPQLPRELSEEEQKALASMDLDSLRSQFEERLRTQKERHDGGNRFIGTGGTSPFGNGGQNPAGVRVGGSGGGRSAVQLAEERRFENLRGDRVLDVRQIGLALRRLKKLARETGPEELDVEETIDKAAKNAGEIELIMRPPRKNRVKLLLLMDVGGSMDPYADLCERLFSAAHQASHFAGFKHYFFHNCVYDRLYSDISRYQGPKTQDVLNQIDRTWSVVLVGDGWMGPYELTHETGGIYWGSSQNGRTSGLDWLKKIRDKAKTTAWLNPEPKRIWNAPTVQLIRRVFPMFELTLDGLGHAVDHLRGARPMEVEPGALP
ncbi:MAG TPA: VWA domain-containing protein [Myxococcota bacterium]